MTETLRSRQKQVARDLIIEAFAAEIVERGVSDVSLQAVADRAGMSHRTLYNYFENREALVEAVFERVETASRAPDVLTTPDDLSRVPGAIRHYFTNWSSQGNLAHALAQLVMAQVSRGGDDLARPGDNQSDAIRAELAAERPDLDPEVADTVAHVMRNLGSVRLWHRMTAEHSVRPEVAAEAAAWAWTVLHDAIRRGEVPGES